jgi:hypothetical protein
VVLVLFEIVGIAIIWKAIAVALGAWQRRQYRLVSNTDKEAAVPSGFASFGRKVREDNQKGFESLFPLVIKQQDQLYGARVLFPSAITRRQGPEPR